MADAEAGRFVDLDTALSKPYPGDQSRHRFADVERLNGATGTSDPAAAGPRGSGEGDGNRPNTIVEA
jgi:hypothetical protein